MTIFEEMVAELNPHTSVDKIKLPCSNTSDRIIIDNNKGASDRYIINMVLKRIADKSFRKEIQDLYVYEKGAVRRLFHKKAVGSLGSPRSTNP